MVLWNGRVAARWLVVALLAMMLATDAGGALAQATPTPIPLDVPAPRECEVAPRAMPLFPEGTGQPVPATPPAFVATPAVPFTPPAGEEADAETVAGITATVREALACRNANDFLRAYALFTQAGLTALFGGPATIDPEIRAAIAEEPRPVPAQQRVALIAVKDVTGLPDGRVGAAVETVNARQSFQDYLVFERDEASGRWLIDGSWVIGDGQDAHPAPSPQVEQVEHLIGT